jgi:thiol-disulfide isomerase/thioredoxin
MSDGESLSRQQFLEIIKNKNKPLFVKFTADWCGPCKKIKPLVDDFLSTDIKTKLQYLEIDIDESIDVYAFMKSRKMLNSIPTLLYYDMMTFDFAPSLAISDSNPIKVGNFLDIIKKTHG